MQSIFESKARVFCEFYVTFYASFVLSTIVFFFVIHLSYSEVRRLFIVTVKNQLLNLLTARHVCVPTGKRSVNFADVSTDCETMQMPSAFIIIKRLGFWNHRFYISTNCKRISSTSIY